MALSAEIEVVHKGNPTKMGIKCVGADTFYAGAFVFADATNGKAQVTDPNAGDSDRFLGVCAKTITTTAADQLVEVYVNGVFAFRPSVAIVEGDIGDVLVLDDDGGSLSDDPGDAVTGAAATLAADDILIGKILALDITETDRAWVKIKPGYTYIALLGWE